MKPAKTLQAITAGSRNVRFDDVVQLAEAFGYELTRVSSSHHIMKHPQVRDVLNLQRRKDGTAKGYQVGQLLAQVKAAGLKLKD